MRYRFEVWVVVMGEFSKGGKLEKSFPGSFWKAAEASLPKPATCDRMKQITASLFQRPNFIIVILSTPCLKSIIANVLRMECVPKWSLLTPVSSSPRVAIVLRKVSRNAVDLRWEYLLPIRMRLTGELVVPRG